MANGQLPIFKKEEQVQDSPSSTQEGLPIFSKESAEPQEQPSQPSEESGAKPSVEQELPIEAAEEPTVEPIDLASFKLPDLSTEDKPASQVRFEEEQKKLEPIGKILAEEEKLFPEIATRAVDETNREEYIKEATGIVESDKEKMKDIEAQFKILSGENTTGKIELPAGVTPEQYVKDLQDQYVTLNRNILATTGAIYDAKSEKGTALGAIRNAAVNGYTNAVQGSVEFVFDALAMIDPAMAGAETREEALKNAREAAKNLAIKDTLDSQLKDKATTEEYLEKIKKGNILNEGLLGATESVFAIGTPAMSGFFAMAYKGAMDEVEDKDLSETEKRQYATTIGLMNLGLERFGFSKAVKGAPGVTQQIAKALGNKVIKEAPKDVTEEVLQRAIAEEVKTFGDKFKRAADPTKFANAFLVEAETGGLQTASEIGIQQAYNWAKEDEVFDIPDNIGEKIIRGAVAEGIGGVAFRGIGATAELVGSGKRNAIANLSTKEFDDLAQKIQDPKALQALKDNLQAQVNLDPSKAPLAQKTLSVVDEISSAFKSVPADTPNRKKVVDVMLDKQRLEKEAENAPDKTIYDKRIKKLDDQIGELIEAPEPVEEAAVPPTEIIEEQEYTQFVDEGVVSEERIQDIATKVTEQQELTPREQEIFTDKTAEVNQRIEEIAAEEVVEPLITQDKFQEALNFIEPIASERRDLTVDEIGNVYEILGENASEVIDIAQKPDAVDLYNSLTDKKKEYAIQERETAEVPVGEEARVSEEVDEEVREQAALEEKVKLPPKTEEQRVIDRIVEGKISPAKKITMSEKAALKKQIQDFARGMREAAKDQRTFAKETNRLISENLQLFGDLRPSQVKALTRKAAKINFANPKSLEDFIDYSAKLEQKTEDQFYKDILKDVTKRTASSKFVERRLSGTLKGKIDNQARKAIKTVNDAVRTNNADLVDVAILNLTQAAELTDGQTAELEGLLIAKDLLSGDVAVAEEAQNQVKELITEGKTKYRDTIKARHEEYVRLKEESIDAITARKGVTSIYGKLTQATKKQPLTDVIAEKLKGFLDYGEGLRTLLDKVDRTAERDESGYGGILDKQIYDPIAKGRATKDALDNEKYEAIVGKLEELYGKDKNKILQENKKPQRLGTFTTAFGDEVQLDLSQNQAYPLYQYMQDANNMDAFRAMGFTDEILQAVEDFLTPEIKEFADWQMNDFYPKYYEDINAVYKKMNDIDLPRQDNYVPISRDLAEVSVTSKEQEVNQSPLNQPQVVYGSLKQRRANKTPFDLSKDGNEKLMQYVDGMNQYIAFAEPIKRMNVVFKDPKVREAIKQNNSIETLKAIDGFINRIANNTMSDGQTIALLDKIRGNTTIASLALAPTVTVKQLTSIPAYAADIPTKQFIKGLGAFGKNPMKAAETLMKSDYMQKRYKDGFERDMLQGMKRDYDNILKGTSNLKNNLMFLTKWGDKGAILMGGYSVYNYHYNKAKAEGKSNAMADKIALEKFEEATKLSQQSTNVEDLSQFQTMGSIGKLFTMYMTSPISYFRQERKSARDFVKGYKSGNKKLMRNAAKRFAIYHLILPIVFQYAANGLPGLLTEWDEDDEKDLLRAATVGSFNGIFIAGSLISYFADVITGKPWVRGGKYSPSPAFDAIVDIINETDDVIEEWNKNPGKFSDEFLEELIDFSTSIDVAIGYPVDRVRKFIDSWKMIANDNSLETREKIALGLFGYSPYIVKPKKKKPTIKPAF